MPAIDPVICICMGVTESVIERVIAEGAASVDQIRTACRANTVCGGCVAELEELLEGLG